MKLVRYRPREHRDACLDLFDGNVGTAFLPEERDGFASFLDDPPGEYFVLVDGTVAAACGGIAFEDDMRTLASVCWTMVARHRQRLGLGRLITNACLDAAMNEVGCTTIRLDTTPQTEAFFHRFDFETVGVERDGYGPGLDRVEMRRPVRR